MVKSESKTTSPPRGGYGNNHQAGRPKKASEKRSSASLPQQQDDQHLTNNKGKNFFKSWYSKQKKKTSSTTISSRKEPQQSVVESTSDNNCRYETDSDIENEASAVAVEDEEEEEGNNNKKKDANYRSFHSSASAFAANAAQAVGLASVSSQNSTNQHNSVIGAPVSSSNSLAYLWNKNNKKATVTTGKYADNSLETSATKENGSSSSHHLMRRSLMSNSRPSLIVPFQDYVKHANKKELLQQKASLKLNNTTSTASTTAVEKKTYSSLIESAMDITASNVLGDFKATPRKSGVLFKQADHLKTWKKRFIVIRKKSLFYYVSNKIDEDSVPRGVISLVDIKVRPVDESKFKRPYCFEIWHPVLCIMFRSVYLMAKSSKDLDQWMTNILSASLETHADKPVLLKKVSIKESLPLLKDVESYQQVYYCRKKVALCHTYTNLIRQSPVKYREYTKAKLKILREIDEFCEDDSPILSDLALFGELLYLVETTIFQPFSPTCLKSVNNENPMLDQAEEEDEDDNDPFAERKSCPDLDASLKAALSSDDNNSSSSEDEDNDSEEVEEDNIFINEENTVKLTPEGGKDIVNKEQNLRTETRRLMTPPPEIYREWGVLALFYDLLLKLIEYTEFLSKTDKKYFFNRAFVINFLSLFKSPRLKERQTLKGILHRLYFKLTQRRALIRREMANVFYEHTYENAGYQGIGELLEILGSIINGFACPIKTEHITLLTRSLIPLHSTPAFVAFHQQLAYCMIQFVSKDSSLFKEVVKGLLRYWPVGNSYKEVIFLVELEELLDHVQSVYDFKLLAVPIAKRLGKCIESPQFQVAERAIFVWLSSAVLQILDYDLATSNKMNDIVTNSIEKCSKNHWNIAIQSKAAQALSHINGDSTNEVVVDDEAKEYCID